MKYVYKNAELLDSVFDEVDTETIIDIYKKGKTPLIISNIKYKNPILENGTLREMTKEELYNKGKYELQYNEIFEDNIIKTVELHKYEKIVNNKVTFDKAMCIKDIEQVIKHKEVVEKEKEFIFKNHKQPNRELEDQTSLLKVISLMQATKQKEFNSWKIYTTNGEEEYVTLTLDELMQMAIVMQSQTTNAMKIATKLRNSLNDLSDEQLMNYDIDIEWRKLDENYQN